MITPIGIFFLICWTLLLRFIHNNVECLVDLHWNHKHWPDGHKKIQWDW